MQEIKGRVDGCDQNMSYYRISTKQEMVVGCVQLVSQYSDATCVSPLPSSSRKRSTILQYAVVSREVVQELVCIKQQWSQPKTLKVGAKCLILGEKQHLVWDTTNQGTK